MSLQCLTILGNKNEPLYFAAPESSKKQAQDKPNNEQVDAFGFLESMDCQSIQHEFMIHAALDRLDELIGSPKNYSLPRSMRGSHWIGSICLMENSEIYGYVTSSNVKILALIKRDEIIPLQKRSDGDIRMLFKVVHDCYVKYTLNPFTPIRSKIEKPCTAFEKGVNMAMKKYNDTIQILQDPTVKKFHNKKSFASGGGGGGGFFSLSATSSSPGLVMK